MARMNHCHSRNTSSTSAYRARPRFARSAASPLALNRRLLRTRHKSLDEPDFTLALRDEEQCAGLPMHYVFAAIPVSGAK
jgi:hypothetical protein